MNAVRFVRVGKAGTDYVLLHDGNVGLRVKFADNWMMPKEDWAASFRGLEGKQAAIPVDGEFFIAVDFLPGDFDGCIRAIPAKFPVASIERF
jgi:hypothetical protein